MDGTQGMGGAGGENQGKQEEDDQQHVDRDEQVIRLSRRGGAEAEQQRDEDQIDRNDQRRGYT